MWKFDIIRDLYNAGLRGRFSLFIESFLKYRQFHVRLGSCYSELFDREIGVPQGSILLVSLFGLKINSVVKAISPGVECSLYVVDFLICYRSKHIHIIERHLQQCLVLSRYSGVCVEIKLLDSHTGFDGVLFKLCRWLTLGYRRSVISPSSNH